MIFRINETVQTENYSKTMLYISILEVRFEAWSYGDIFYPGSHEATMES